MNEKKKNSTLIKTSLSEQLINIFLDRITSVHYAPGSRIDIEQLKQEFNVSHIPIRDALHKLSEQGLVKIIPRIGYFVTELSKEEIDEIFEVRTMLEVYSVEKGMKKKRIDKTLLESLKNEYHVIKSKLSVNGMHNNVEHFFAINEKLHKDVIVRSSQSQIINSIYMALFNRIRLSSRVVYLPNDDIEEHLKIIDCLLNDDIIGVRKTLRKHLHSVKLRTHQELSDRIGK